MYLYTKMTPTAHIVCGIARATLRLQPRKPIPLSCIFNTLLYVAGLLGWLGFRPFDAPYTQRIRIGWGQMMVLFIWPQSHLYGKINTKARSSLCCPWWGQHLGHYSGPICSLSRKSAKPRTHDSTKFRFVLLEYWY